MTYLATVEGVYKSRLYINLILFKIARGWRIDRFSWSKQVDIPQLKIDYEPLKNVPLGVTLQVSESGVDFGLEVLNHDIPIEHLSFPEGSKNFHWQPLKGVVIDGAASFQKVEAA